MAAFVVMIFGSLSLKFLGQIFISEILLSVYFFFSWLNGKFQINPESNIFFKRYFLFLTLAVIGQLSSDVYRGTVFESSTKGFFLLIFTMLNLAGLIRLTRMDVNRYFWALSGWSLGLILNVILDPPDLITSQSLLWKFGLGYPITIIFFVLLSFRKLNLFLLLVGTLILSTIHIINDARSLSLFTLVSSLVIFLTNRQNRPLKSTAESERPIRTIAKMLVIIISLSLVVMLFLENQNENNKSTIKFREQAQSISTLKPLSLLISARSELIPQFYAIKASPIIGYGSYAPNTEDIKANTNNFLTMRQSTYLQLRLERSSSGLIPIHSSLFQNWIWFGVIAIPFFLLLIRDSIRGLAKRGMPPIMIFLAIQSMWDVFFSPYAGLRRIQFPLLILGLGISAFNLKKDRRLIG